MEDADHMETANARPKQDRVTTSYPTSIFDATLDSHRADVGSFPQQIERPVDLIRIGKCLLEAPFPRAIPPYARKIAMSAA